VAAGVDIRLLGPMPTPGVAYLTRTFRAAAGIVITASHNPYDDNGIKFFSAERRQAAGRGRGHRGRDRPPLKRCRRPARQGQAHRRRRRSLHRVLQGQHPGNDVPAGLKIVLDCAHGATYNIAPFVFEELGADVSPSARPRTASTSTAMSAPPSRGAGRGCSTRAPTSASPSTATATG
jgi:phosphoglucosamine mutase